MNTMHTMNTVPCTCGDDITCPICDMFKQFKPVKKYALNVIDRKTGKMNVIMLSEKAYKRMNRHIAIKHWFQSLKQSMSNILWLVWRWVRGYATCYEMHKDGKAFCKRRSGHLGSHRTSSGFSWIKEKK